MEQDSNFNLDTYSGLICYFPDKTYDYEPINHINDNYDYTSSRIHDIDYSQDLAWDNYRSTIQENELAHQEEYQYEFAKQELNTNYQVQETILTSSDFSETKQILEKEITNPRYYHDELRDLKEYILKYDNRNNTKEFVQKKLDFINMILDGTVLDLLDKIQHGNLRTAKGAFEQLRTAWPWENNHSFLLDSSNPFERGFVSKIRINVMRAAESELLSRSDYLYAINHKVLGILKYYQIQYSRLQKTGNKVRLLIEKQELIDKLTQPKNRNNLGFKVQLIAIETLLKDPLTQVLSTITNASLDKAQKELKHFTRQILKNYSNERIANMDTKQALSLIRKGLDSIKTAQWCYKIRRDCPSSVEYGFLLSDSLPQILETLSTAEFEVAKAELEHIEKQAIEQFAPLQITDMAEIRAKMTEQMGIDFLDVCSTFFELNPNYQEITANKLLEKETSLEESLRQVATLQPVQLESAIIQQTELLNLYQEYNFGNEVRIQQRLDALKEIQNGNVQITQQEYLLKQAEHALLEQYDIDPKPFLSCKGNQLQQLVHQDCIDIIVDAAQIKSGEYLHDFVPAILDFAETARAYNQIGQPLEAINLIDLCWGILDCGQAVIEGVGEGLISAGTDLVKHPITTAVSVVAAPYVLAFQLTRLR